MHLSHLLILWRRINSTRSSGRAFMESTGDHCISGVAERWVIDQLPNIQSNLFVKMAGTARQVPLQMLNHRAGLTTHPSIDFLAHVTAGKPENNLPIVHWHSTDSAAQEREHPSFSPWCHLQQFSGSMATLLEEGVVRASEGEQWSAETLQNSAPLGLALESTNGQRQTVLWKSAKALTCPFKKSDGDSVHLT